MFQVVMLFALFWGSALQVKAMHNITEFVRLVNGSSLCSGRVVVKSNQSWVSVNKDDFDQRDAEVVCRELGCGAPTDIQGALYGEADAPMWTEEFQCEGNESALLNCTTNTTRNTSSPDKVVELTCSALHVKAMHNITESEDVRLVGGTSNCTGILEINRRGEWRPAVFLSYWNMYSSAVVCRQLDCGSAVSTEIHFNSTYQDGWMITSHCVGSESSLRECGTTEPLKSNSTMKVVCSESVRLVNGTCLCSGRVEVKSNQSWVSVYKDDFGQQDAQVVCRELGCGAPSEVQGALYGEVDAPMWTKSFQCEGNESVLKDCSTNSTRNTSSPDKAVGLTCSVSGDVRLMGGTSNCSGTLEMKHQEEWRPVFGWSDWNLQSSSVVCRQLDCGSAVSTEISSGSEYQLVWWFTPYCVGSESSLQECVIMESYNFTEMCLERGILKMNCSESVRLVNGTSLCSGRVEVKSNQSWDSVYKDDFNQLDAEVVCRELDCGAPSDVQVALYREVDAPLWTDEFQCEGNESARLDCSTNSTRNISSSDKAVGLTCSVPGDVRLVGGTTNCTGTLEMNHQGEWRPVVAWSDWNLKSSSVVCRQLGCGSVVSTERSSGSMDKPVWWMSSYCVGSESSLGECVIIEKYSFIWTRWNTGTLNVSCSEFVRLVNGTTFCSGRVEVQSNNSWASVYEDDFDQQDAEVVCRELGCGTFPVLHGALYEEMKAQMWTEEFQCEGNESVLQDCSTNSTRNTSSPDKTVGLTCSVSSDVRLVEGTSKCIGLLEIRHQGEWSPVNCGSDWNQKSSSVVCRQLDCGSGVSTESSASTNKTVWWITSSCVGSESSLRECIMKEMMINSTDRLMVICSDLLFKPNITFSMNGVSEGQQKGLQVFEGSNITITCSIQPQYPGGYFHLTTGSNTTHNYTLPAVNYSASFQFPAVNHTHQGTYSCVYHIYVFSHNFSSESEFLPLTVTASHQTSNIIRVTVALLVLLLLLLFRILNHLWKGARRQRAGVEDTEMDYYDVVGFGADSQTG